MNSKPFLPQPSIQFSTDQYPISVDRFNHLDKESITLAEGTNAHTIMSFLVRHPDEAFRWSELLDQTGVKEGSIGPTLQRLHEHGLVRHRQNYWTVGPEERLGQVASLTATFESINRHYELEPREDWLGDDE